MAKRSDIPIIIKKVKGKGHGGHHGGAWKVAYADFVTAMMAFFLLLWLLNVTTDVQKRGIADYFEPTIAEKQEFSGSGGILGGTVLGQPGALRQDSAAPSVAVPIPAELQPEDGDEGQEESTQQGEASAREATDADEASAVKSDRTGRAAPLSEKAARAQFAADLAKMADAAKTAPAAERQDRQFAA